MQVHDSILDVVGGTPLVRLSRLGRGLAPTLLAKVEYLNPGGSVKDRIGLAMVERAEGAGQLKPGGTIVEPTSGNTGAGLAIVAALKGYRCVFVMPDKMSQEKIALLRGYGAEVVITPTAVPPDSPESYYSVANRLTEEIPGAVQPNQYRNPANPEAHYRSTGPELWEQTGGAVDVFVAGIGTGGTITGVGRYLKERKPGLVVVGADPEGSIYTSDDVHPYLVEGVGEDFWPETFDRSLVDRYVTVSDRDAFLMTRRLAREEGLLVGGSCGLAVVAAVEVAKELGREATIAVLLPDSGRGYLTKVFNDDWLGQYGFPLDDESARDRQTVGEVLRGKDGRLPDLVHTHPSETIAEAVHILREYGVSQMPVVRAEPPIVAAEVAGSVSERDLLDALFTGHAALTDPVEDHMSPALPTIGSTEAASDAVTLLESADAALVHEDGKPVGVLTRQDLLAYLARPRA
jgi:cystathionine beta-synthase